MHPAVVDLGASLYSMYGLKGLRGPLFNDLIDRIEAEDRAERMTRDHPENNRRGILDLCDDPELFMRPIDDYLYDPNATILVVTKSPNQRDLFINMWRQAIVEAGREHEFKFTRDSIHTEDSERGKLMITSVQTIMNGAPRGLLCKAIYVHYSLWNNPRGRDMIEDVLRPSVIGPFFVSKGKDKKD